MSVPQTTLTQGWNAEQKFPEKLVGKVLLGWVLKPPRELG